MKYVGSKNRLAKDLVPIIQSFIKDDTVAYIEPFVGGANMIDKINCKKKIGCDIHEELIELFKFVQVMDNKLPLGVTKDEYVKVRDNRLDFEKWYVGLVGFCATYNAKYFGGYAGECNTKEGVRHYDREAIRNLENQRANLKDVKFVNTSFLDLPKDKIKNCVVYCDLPYRDSTKYETETFPYDAFYDWCVDISKDNVVLISEYAMPSDRFDEVWSKSHKTSLDKNDNKKTRVEKLFMVKGGKR